MITMQSGIVDIIPEYNRALRPIFCISEGDNSSRSITITVKNAGENFVIPGGSEVYVVGRKIDNTIFTYSCVYSGYTVTVDITDQMSAVSGLVLCELKIVRGSESLGSANFVYWVEPSPIENGIASESDLNIFEQAIADLGGYEFLTDEVAVLSARMDQFARLPDGSLSTAADAELADVRVKANGQTAATAGDAVREQVTELKDDLDYISDNLIGNGYTVANNMYLATNAKKIFSHNGLALVVIPITPSTKYRVHKATSTIMRVATAENQPVVDGTYTNISYHASASSDALDITSGVNDAYMLIQLYANSDSSSLKSVDANIGTLTVIANPDRIDTIENAVTQQAEVIGRFHPNYVDGYVIYDGLYINKSNNQIFANADFKIVRVEIKGGRTYAVKKDTATVMRVGSSPSGTPQSGTWLSQKVQHSVASADALSITTNANDGYMYIQLWVASDDASLRSVDANIATLTIYDVTDDYENVPLIPYAWGSLNWVSRLGWTGYPEQSLAAYRAAYDKTCRVMLCDVRVAQDGTFVCYHNETLGNIPRHSDHSALTEDEKNTAISSLTIEELNTYDFGYYAGGVFAGTKILQLSQFLAWCAKYNCWAMLEIKVSLTSLQIASISKLVKRYGLQDRILIGNFYNLYTGTEYNDWMEQLPYAKMVVLGAGGDFERALPIAQHYSSNGFDTYLGWATPASLTDEIIDTCLENNLKLWYTEITSETEMQSFYDSGYLDYYSIISSSYLNINRWVVDNVMP